MPLTAEQHQHLEASLRNRLQVIADHQLRDSDPAAHLEKLKQVSEEIEYRHQSWKSSMPRDLRHYLQQMSYQKALDWLDHNPVELHPSDQ